VPIEATEFAEATTDIQTFSFLRQFVHLLGFNVAHSALADLRVRRAIALAIDRDALIDHVFGGRAVAAASPIWSRHWASDASLDAPAHDRSRAQRLLTEALGRPARRDAATPVLRLSCVLPAGYPAFERSALVLQRQLLEVGIDLEPEIVPVQELTRRLAAGAFQTYLFELSARPDLNWTYWFWHSPGESAPWVRSGYRAADALLDRVRRAATPEEVRTSVHALQRKFVEDPPAVFLAWSETSRAVRRRFAIPQGPDRDVFTVLPQWRLAREEERE
jgi:ABC-type transport system substrate-binding protein